MDSNHRSPGSSPAASRRLLPFSWEGGGFQKADIPLADSKAHDTLGSAIRIIAAAIVGGSCHFRGGEIITWTLESPVFGPERSASTAAGFFRAQLGS